MGICQRTSQKDNSQKQTGYESEQVIILTCIKSHIEYFDQIDFELLKYPDISLLLRKHIKNYKFIEEGKTWVVVKEIQSFLNNKITILIRNFNPETDAALQLIQILRNQFHLLKNYWKLQLDLMKQRLNYFNHSKISWSKLQLNALLLQIHQFQRNQNGGMKNIFDGDRIIQFLLFSLKIQIKAIKRLLDPYMTLFNYQQSAQKIWEILRDLKMLMKQILKHNKTFQINFIIK